MVLSIFLIGSVSEVGGAHALSGLIAFNDQPSWNNIDLVVKHITESDFLGRAALEMAWEDTVISRAPMAVLKLLCAMS